MWGWNWFSEEKKEGSVTDIKTAKMAVMILPILPMFVDRTAAV